jgi:hypothetical protein
MWVRRLDLSIANDLRPSWTARRARSASSAVVIGADRRSRDGERAQQFSASRFTLLVSAVRARCYM